MKLPKLGWIGYRNSRGVLGEIGNITVSRQGGKWFMSAQTERTVEQPLHPSESVIGEDVGIARFVTRSDGSYLSPLNSFKRHEKALCKAQQSLSRKVRFNRNWKKAKARVTRIHARIAHVRGDFLHKASTTTSKNHAVVVCEDLKVSNMSGSAKGTTDAPGRNMKAKSGLNNAILDQGWGMYVAQLEYKLAWNGGRLIKVPPQYTSQTCPCCGHVSQANRKTQAQFACVDCGYENHADHVGAINILSRGMKSMKRDEGQDMSDASLACGTSTARIACEVSGAAMPPAAGTHRSDSSSFRLNAVGIPFLSALMSGSR